MKSMFSATHHQSVDRSQNFPPEQQVPADNRTKEVRYPVLHQGILVKAVAERLREDVVLCSLTTFDAIARKGVVELDSQTCLPNSQDPARK
jgi:hypothetical protein